MFFEPMPFFPFYEEDMIKSGYLTKKMVRSCIEYLKERRLEKLSSYREFTKLDRKLKREVAKRFKNAEKSLNNNRGVFLHIDTNKVIKENNDFYIHVFLDHHVNVRDMFGNEWATETFKTYYNDNSASGIDIEAEDLSEQLHNYLTLKHEIKKMREKYDEQLFTVFDHIAKIDDVLKQWPFLKDIIDAEKVKVNEIPSDVRDVMKEFK